MNLIHPNQLYIAGFVNMGTSILTKKMTNGTKMALNGTEMEQILLQMAQNDTIVERQWNDLMLLYF